MSRKSADSRIGAALQSPQKPRKAAWALCSPAVAVTKPSTKKPLGNTAASSSRREGDTVRTRETSCVPRAGTVTLPPPSTVTRLEMSMEDSRLKVAPSDSL